MKVAIYGLTLAAVVIADGNSNDDSGSSSSEAYTCEYGSSCWNQLNVIAPSESPNSRNGGAAPPPAAVTITVQPGGIMSGLLDATENNSAQQAEEDDDDQTNSPPNPQGRFGAKLPIQMVANYGCWCYAYSQWETGQGRSRARDEHDDNCKAHSMGFKCISIDAKYENKECHPYETDYDLTVTRDGYGTILLECADSIADDWCRRRTCMVELRLLARYWKLFDNGIWPEWRKWAHPNIGGSFDPLQKCNPSPGVEPIELRCCGDYPYRSWYYSIVSDPNQGRTQCCVYEDTKINEAYGFFINIGQIYNKNHQTCTDKGVVQGVADQPDPVCDATEPQSTVTNCGNCIAFQNELKFNLDTKYLQNSMEIWNDRTYTLYNIPNYMGAKSELIIQPHKKINSDITLVFSPRTTGFVYAFAEQRSDGNVDRNGNWPTLLPAQGWTLMNEKMQWLGIKGLVDLLIWRLPLENDTSLTLPVSGDELVGGIILDIFACNDKK